MRRRSQMAPERKFRSAAGPRSELSNWSTGGRLKANASPQALTKLVAFRRRCSRSLKSKTKQKEFEEGKKARVIAAHPKATDGKRTRDDKKRKGSSLVNDCLDRIAAERAQGKAGGAVAMFFRFSRRPAGQ